MDDLKLYGDVVYITEEEQSINWKWEKGYNKISRGMQIISENDFRTILDKDVYSVDCVEHIEVGTTFMKHPFLKNRYLDINNAECTLFKDKLNCMANISKHLGVTRFEAKAVFLEEGKRELDCSGEMKCKYVDISTKYKEQQDSNYSKTYSREENFSGNELTVDTHRIALELAKVYGLDRDSDIDYLLKQRDPNHNNRLISQKIKLELSRELNTYLDCAFSLTVLGGIFSLSANFKEITSKKKRVILETSLIF